MVVELNRMGYCRTLVTRLEDDATERNRNDILAVCDGMRLILSERGILGFQLVGINC